MKNQLDGKIQPKTRKKLSKKGKILLGVLLVALLLPLVTVAGFSVWFAVWQSGIDFNAELLPTAAALPAFYDRDGEQLPYMTDKYVGCDEVSDNLKYAFVAIEDKRFYSHKGYDPIRIAGALLKNLRSGSIKEGASTITQQLVKNTHLSSERTYKRKLKEIAIAADIEKAYTKDEIMSMYLSVIYFGNGCYGVKSAAMKYFGKRLNELTLSECAALAGIVKNPSKFRPDKNPQNCAERRNLVLSLMQEQGFIDQNSYLNASNEPISVVEQSAGTDDGYAAYISRAKAQAMDILGLTEYQFDNMGLKIYTNMDRRLQEELRSINCAHLSDKSVNSVSVILGNDGGETLAYASTLSYDVSRQVGSAIKPLAVYAPAFDMGVVSPASYVVDERISYNGYSPENFGGHYYGETNVREAVARSMNSVSVKLLSYIGVDKSVEYLEKMGYSIPVDSQNYSLALGAASLSPVEVAEGYMTLANSGAYAPASFVSCIARGSDKIYSHSLSNRRKQVFSAPSASLMTSSLVSAVKDGTARSLGALPFEVAAKTGTVERGDGKNSDGWIAGYNDDCTVVVWHGSDDGMTEMGGGLPARQALDIWKKLDELYGMSKKIRLSGVCEMDIDTYSTKMNKCVTAATALTPGRYIKSELFAIDRLPATDGSRFLTLAPPEFSVQMRDGYVLVSFDCEEIYAYELTCTDLLGERIVSVAADKNGEETVTDMPLQIGGVVTYTLKKRLSGREEYVSDSKQIFYDMGFDLPY